MMASLAAKRTFTISLLLASLALLPPVMPRSDAQAYCAGSECLEISNVRHGTRCGTSDSIEVDIHNGSPAYLRGYVVFTSPAGKKTFAPTGLMPPGKWFRSVEYTCHGIGNPYGIANTGDMSVRYPPQK